MRISHFAAAGLALWLTACGGAATATVSTSPAATSPATTPAASASAQAPTPKPEKASISIALPSDTAGTMPTRIGQDAGYFAKYGLTVNVNIVSAATAAQALTSGSVDMYHGGTTPISADLGGADLIYVASPVDRSNLVLIGQNGITSFEQLRGKSVGTTTPGAFGEVAMKVTAKKYGLEIPKDIKLLYHPSSSASLTTFLSNNSDGLIAPPPFSTQATDKGFPVIVDFYKQGFKIVGPALSASRDFYQRNPNTVRAFLMGYLDSLKRSLDDPQYFKSVESKYAKITDQALLDSDYQDALRTWNKDLRVDPASIQVVLDASDDPKAKGSDVKHFYDNTVVDQVMRDYAAKLFP
jgi:ABC-type nitrate/sulfonate/bicarbonate transport system substrate-binding protein